MVARPFAAALALGCFAAAVGFAVPAAAAGPTISTAAGTGVAGYTGDGGQATAAQLMTPAGVAVDGSGNVYVADEGANVVRKITPAGVISTVAGTGVAGFSGNGGAATAAKLDSPTDIVVAPNGTLFIADFSNSVVRKVLPNGIISNAAGTGIAGYSGDGGPGPSAKLVAPVGLDVDSAGNVYIADYGNGTVRKLAASGTISTLAGTGVAGFAGDGGPATAAQLNRPCDVLYAAGTVYVADGSNARIRAVSPGGTINTVAGTGAIGSTGDGGPATAATFMFPTGLAKDSIGNLFIADFSANVIRMIAPGGVISTVAGTGVAGYTGDGGDATAATFSSPARVNLDVDGDLFVSDWSNHVVREVTAIGAAATAPDAPTGVVATAGDAQADVSWTPPVSDGGVDLTGYQVTPNDGTTDLPAVPVAAGTTSTTITGLTNATTYTFTVTATNAAGTSPASTPSNPVTPTAPPPPATAPDAPTGVTATGGDAQADISWTTPADDGGSPITGYQVTPNDGTTDLPAVPVAAGTTSTTITGLTNATTYTFTVTATNAAGTSPASTPSNPVTPTAPPPPATAPDAPTGVTATGGDAQADISWTTPADDGGSPITGYQVTPNDGTTDLPAVPVAAGTTSTTITGLTNATTYTFTVTATNAAGTSPASTPSNPVTPTAPPPPATAPDAPTGVTATGGDAQADISWTTPADDGGSPITGYQVTPNDGTTDLPAVPVAAGTTSTTITGLTNATTYTFTVTATNAAGTSPASTPSNPVTPTAPPPPATAPDAPTGVTATGGDAQADISWTTPADDGGSPITGYQVTPNDGTTDLPAVPVAAGTTSTTITGLTNATTYTFTVTATNAAGTSPASTPSNPVTPTAPTGGGGPGGGNLVATTAPGAPRGVTAVGGDGQIVVTWTPPTNDGGSPITAYSVTVSAGDATSTVIVDGDTTSATVTGLTDGTAYTITVTATNSAGTSPAGSADTAVTPTAPPGVPTTVGATPTGDGAIKVTWTAPDDDGGTPITNYTVIVSDGQHTTTVTVNGDATSATVTGLTEGATYTVTVVATNATGRSAPSLPSAPVTPTTADDGRTDHDGPGDGHNGTGSGDGDDGDGTATEEPIPPARTDHLEETPSGFAATEPVDAPKRSAHHRDGHKPAATDEPMDDGTVEVTPTPTRLTDTTGSVTDSPSTLETLRHVAIVVSKNGAVPLGLLLLIGLFLLVQDRFDRRDPKLALAPVYADPGVAFTPAMS